MNNSVIIRFYLYHPYFFIYMLNYNYFLYNVAQTNLEKIMVNKNSIFLYYKLIYFNGTSYTIKHIYKVQKATDVATIDHQHFLQAGPEAESGLGDGVSVYVGHGVPDDCLKILNCVVEDVVYTLSKTSYTKISGEF